MEIKINYCFANIKNKEITDLIINTISSSDADCISFCSKIYEKTGNSYYFNSVMSIIKQHKDFKLLRQSISLYYETLLFKKYLKNLDYYTIDIGIDLDKLLGKYMI